MLNILQYQFFQNAVIGGTITAIACACIGLFLILRKEAMMSDGIAHTAFGGIAIGMALNINPIFTALLIAIFSVLLISFMKDENLAESDSAIAVMMATGFSVGLIIISLTGGFNVELFNYLFGSILTISNTDLSLIFILGLITITFLSIFYREMLSITFDRKSAKLSEIPVKKLSIAFNLLVALTIVISIKVIGIILVVALMVLPGLTALQLNFSFKKTLLATVFFSILSVHIGIIISSMYDIATSGVIVFTGVALFLVTIFYKKMP